MEYINTRTSLPGLSYCHSRFVKKGLSTPQDFKLLYGPVWGASDLSHHSAIYNINSKITIING